MTAFIALIRMTLWQRRWSIFWWSVALTAFIALNIGLYPSFRDQAAELNRSLSNIPRGVVDLFSDTGDFLSPIGFLSSQIYYLMLPLMLSILAIGLGSSLLAREEKHGTIELLLARPVSRTKLLLAKMGAGLLVMACVGFVLTIVCTVLIKVVGFGVPMRYAAVATVAAVSLAVLFGTVAFVVSAFGRGARAAAAGVAALIAFGGYLVTSLSGTVHWLAWPAKLLPYHYYQPSEILRSNPNWAGIGGIMATTILLTLIAWIGFRRRDIG